MQGYTESLVAFRTKQTSGSGVGPSDFQVPRRIGAGGFKFPFAPGGPGPGETCVHLNGAQPGAIPARADRSESQWRKPGRALVLRWCPLALSSVRPGASLRALAGALASEPQRGSASSRRATVPVVCVCVWCCSEQSGAASRWAAVNKRQEPLKLLFGAH